MVCAAALVSAGLISGCDSNDSDDESFPFGFDGNRWLIEGSQALERESGEAYQFLHVTLGGSSGNGSASSPFGSIDQALSEADPGSVVSGSASITTRV